MAQKIDFKNILVTYLIEQKDVQYVGKLTAVVKISQKPIFDNNTSIDVKFLSPNKADAIPTDINCFHNLGASSIRYKS